MVNEKQLTQNVVGLAHRLGWEHVYHTWRSDNSPAGYPDIVALRAARQVVAELKVGKNNLSAEQYFFLLAFVEAGTEVYVWWDTDEDWNEMCEVFR